MIFLQQNKKRRSHGKNVAPKLIQFEEAIKFVFLGNAGSWSDFKG
jgi:hypothetical protein